MSSLRDRMNRLRGKRPEEQAAGTDSVPDIDAAAETESEADVQEDARTGTPDDTQAGTPEVARTGTPNDTQAGTPEVARTGTPDGGMAESGEAHSTAQAIVAEAELLDPAWEALGVGLASNEWGEFLLRRTAYPFDYRHGDHALGELADCAHALAAFHEGVGERPGLSTLLFLDLETTGLGVGTGNVPFMTGIAFFEDGRFVVEQALIRHPAEERAMLAYIRERVEGRPYLVTYNGRTFDWPVLAGRYIMNGMGRKMAEPRHLDFLHPSRSIWRNTLPSLKLSRVEEERLGIFRVDDVPGSMAPAVYFQFLSDGKPEPLEGVFRHNELDMLSLACLAVRFGRLLSGGLGTHVAMPEESEELVRTGLWLDRMGRSGEAEPLFERLAARDDAGAWCNMLAERDKRCGNWDRAVLLWQKAAHAADMQQLSSGEAHIELSMYYEHKRKDYETALRHASAALELAARRAGMSRLDSKKRAEAEAIRKRIERLQKKAGRNYA